MILAAALGMGGGPQHSGGSHSRRTSVPSPELMSHRQGQLPGLEPTQSHRTLLSEGSCTWLNALLSLP